MNKTYQIFVYPEADTKLLSHIKFLAQVSQSAAENLYNSYKIPMHNARLQTNQKLQVLKKFCTNFYPFPQEFSSIINISDTRSSTGQPEQDYSNRIFYFIGLKI